MEKVYKLLCALLKYKKINNLLNTLLNKSNLFLKLNKLKNNKLDVKKLGIYKINDYSNNNLYLMYELFHYKFLNMVFVHLLWMFLSLHNCII